MRYIVLLNNLFYRYAGLRLFIFQNLSGKLVGSATCREGSALVLKATVRAYTFSASTVDFFFLALLYRVPPQTPGQDIEHGAQLAEHTPSAHAHTLLHIARSYMSQVMQVRNHGSLHSKGLSLLSLL